MSVIGDFFKKYLVGRDSGNSESRGRQDGNRNLEAPSPEDKYLPGSADERNPPAGTGKLPLDRKQWTVLFYGNGNASDIDFGVNRSMRGAAAIGSDKNVNLIGQFSSYKKGGEAERFYMDKPDQRNSAPVLRDLEKLGKTDMGSPESLREFLTWGIKKYPAHHYMVILAGHGGHFDGCLPDHISGNHIDNEQLGSVLADAAMEAGKKIDVLGLDCCGMAGAETAFALKDSVDYMVASEELSISGGWSYWTLTNAMTYGAGKGELSTEQALNAILKAQERFHTISVLNLGTMTAFAPVLRNFSWSLLNTTTNPAIIRDSFQRAQHYSQESLGAGIHRPFNEVRDLHSLASQIEQNGAIADTALRSAAGQVRTCLGSMFVAGFYVQGLNLEDSHGMSIYAPVKEAGGYIDIYSENTRFNQETGWSEVVRKFACQQ